VNNLSIPNNIFFRIVLIDVRNSTELKTTGKIPGTYDIVGGNQRS
jgi:hypothetical protein